MTAVIYCRVSSKEQVEGTSLESQLLACRDYARKNNWTVSEVFIEEGESAKFADRTRLLELLNYCKDKTHKIDRLLVWKIDRFARNVEDHFTLKGVLKKLGVQVVSVTEPIQADPNGKLLETILAGFAQFDNDVRALRTVQGMQQRLREGLWPWRPPFGYRPPKAGRKTQPDKRDPQSFEPLQRAWKMFATGSYSKADILRLLHNWGVPGYSGGVVLAQQLDRMFRNPYYAGVVHDPWSGEEYSGQHEAMVSTVEFARVQTILSGRGNSQPHLKLTDDFPLRGVVRCPSCEAPMTGYFAKGRRHRYPYYKCFRHLCSTRSKSYAAHSVHDEFSQALTATSVPHFVASAIISTLVDAHWEQADHYEKANAGKKEDAERLKRQLQELISMRAARLITDDEFMTQRNKIKTNLFKTQSSLQETVERSLTVGEIGELAGTLSNLDAAWRLIPVEAKRGFGTLLFPAGYVFQQVRTAETGLLFKTIGTSGDDISHLAAQGPEILNTIFADIRKLLALIRPVERTEKKAA